MIKPNDLKLAVLIDADNISYQHIGAILQEIAKHGDPTFKRLYGDMTKPYLTGWKSVLLEHAITPIQQFGYTTGKNSSDSALIIDAMDILYTGEVDGFCIVSSDSDFTRLATRLRESGKIVLGFGEKKTPQAFIAACNRFTYIEILNDQDALEEETLKEGNIENPKKNIPKPAVKQKQKLDPTLTKLIKKSISDIAEDDGWVFLGVLGNLLMKQRPDFDPRNYGYTKLLDIIKDIQAIEIDKRSTNKPHVYHFYIRLK